MEHKEWEELRREYETVSMSKVQVEKMKEEIMRGKRDGKRQTNVIIAARCAAAVVAALIILPNTSAGVAHAMSRIPVIGKLVEAVTFRDYHYEDEKHNADVEVPKLVVKENTAVETEDLQREETLQKTTEEMNREIAEITEQIISEFQEGMKSEEGYQDLVIKHEVIGTTDLYFTLKLICYQASGSGAEWDYFYTIDLQTGERLALQDLFVEGADYRTPISREIQKQMKEQMDRDENLMYWLDNEDIPEWNFQQIEEDVSFYVNDDNDVVIAFNEGDVAPMYMGCVEFVIPKTVLEDIRK